MNKPLLAMGYTESDTVTVTTHTAKYALMNAPVINCGFYYYPEVNLKPEAFTVVWTDDNEPSHVQIHGRKDTDDQPHTLTYGIRQTPKWLFECLQEQFMDRKWKILFQDAESRLEN